MELTNPWDSDWFSAMLGWMSAILILCLFGAFLLLIGLVLYGIIWG